MDAPVRLSVRITAFRYGDDSEAVQDIRLDVRRGEFVGILGANGSGKTTLLRLMDGMHKHFQGEILLDGEDITRLSPKRIYAKMGLVFQNPDEQLFAATVAEDVAFGPLNMGLGREEVDLRVREALAAVEMEHAAGKSIHHLSYGQKKRICIAGLLAMGHEILLMDEPTAGLDPMGEYRMMRLIMDLNRNRGVTVVMATHSVDLVPLFLDRLFILSRGKILRGGTPEEVFTAPAEMESVKLRLPYIADMLYKLKHEDRMRLARIPLTVGEARREIIRLVEERGDA